jgi:hypothetical protein
VAVCVEIHDVKERGGAILNLSNRIEGVRQRRSAEGSRRSMSYVLEPERSYFPPGRHQHDLNFPLSLRLKLLWIMFSQECMNLHVMHEGLPMLALV